MNPEKPSNDNSPSEPSPWDILVPETPEAPPEPEPMLEPEPEPEPEPIPELEPEPEPMPEPEPEPEWLEPKNSMPETELSREP